MWAIKIANINLGYECKMADYTSSSNLFLKLFSQSSILKNVTWDQLHSQLPILNFEKSRRA